MYFALVLCYLKHMTISQFKVCGSTFHASYANINVLV